MTTLRIAVGASPASGDATGVATYGRTLVTALGGTGPPALQVTGTADGSQPLRARRWLRALLPFDRWLQLQDGVLIRRDVYREAQVFFDIHSRTMRLLCAGEPGVVHWTYPVPLYLASWINVYTVHDAIPLTQPGLTPILENRHRRLISTLAASDAFFVTVSKAAHAEILQAMPIRPDRLVNLSQAVEAVSDDGGALPPGIPAAGFILFCGTIEPRKNLLRLAKAHASSGLDVPLVVVGEPGWKAAPIMSELRRSPGIILLDKVDRPTLERLIARATAVAMPSLAEGFGLPVAEAMSAGTPVLTSDRGALAEAAGGAALLVDPENVEAIAMGLRIIMTDAALRERLAVLGRQRARDFTIAAYGGKLRSYYDGLRDGI